MAGGEHVWRGEGVRSVVCDALRISRWQYRAGRWSRDFGAHRDVGAGDINVRMVKAVGLAEIS